MTLSSNTNDYTQMADDNQDQAYVEVTWHDPKSTAVGYLVVHNLPGTGLATGGTRMRAGCTIQEVRDLASCMSLKTTTFNLKVGGAKGGIDYDPKAPDAVDVLARFMTAMRPWLDAHWVTAEDLGVPQQRLDDVFRSLNLGQSYHAAIQRSANPQATLDRVTTDMKAKVDGKHEIGDIAGGYGVAQACFGVIKAKHWRANETSAAVQGIGTMGGGAAWYLHQAGVKVVALADAQGCLYNDQGLDVPSLLDMRDASGEINRNLIDDPNIQQLDRDAILSCETDILVPAATSYVINEAVAKSVSASVIVEAANASTTPDGEQELQSRGIPVVPDFVANAGAVVWAWWLLTGYINQDTDATLEKLKKEIGGKTAKLIQTWDKHGIMPRVTAKQAVARLMSAGDSQTIHIP